MLLLKGTRQGRDTVEGTQYDRQQLMLSVVIYPSVKNERNPYLSILAEGLEATGCAVRSWTWLPFQNAPDVVILNWLEHIWMPGGSFFETVKRFVQRRYFLLRISLYRWRGTQVLFVLHNTVPHLWSGTQAHWNRRCTKLWTVVDGVVHMTEASQRDLRFDALKQKPSTVIPHPHYALVEQSNHAAKAERICRLVFVGGLETRKNALQAVREALTLEGFEVFVSGPGDVVPFQDILERDTAAELHLHLDALSDDDLYELFDEPAAIVLNQREALNSGMVFLALSRGAPVICPATSVNIELRKEFGSQWIRVFEGEISAATLRILASEPVPGVLPDLTNRTAQKTGEGYVLLIKDLHAR